MNPGDSEKTEHQYRLDYQFKLYCYDLVSPWFSSCIIKFCITVLALLNSNLAFPHSAHKEEKETPPIILAPGYQVLTYTAPEPGSYLLPSLGSAGNGRVLRENGSKINLHDLLGDKLVIMSFIYTTCDDINGCPLATYVSSQVQNRLIKEPGISNSVRLISMSFDPVNDTPSVMAQYGTNFKKKEFDWHFLTTASEKDLDPLLASYDQSIQKDIDENGKAIGTISHILRVYLIDRNKNIRNIYSTSFLHPDTVINDIKTIILEDKDSSFYADSRTYEESVIYGPGDYKGQYDSSSYQTRALSLTNRQGQPVNLLNNISSTPTGLPPVPEPANNKTTMDKIELGRKLFYDRRLSHNNTISCAMCHIPEQGFSSNELATAVGIEGRTVRRNAPTIYNVAYLEKLFHDGRESALEQQVWGPLLAFNEMGNPSIGHVINKINSLPDYQDRFKQAFNRDASMETVGMALASYERTLVSGNSKFDQWYFNKEPTMSQAAINGFNLFKGKARCISCHTIEKKFALFTDNKLHNTGIGYLNSMKKQPAQRSVLVAPGTYLEIDTASISDSSEPTPNDLGFYEISGDPGDRWKYRTPGLRNVALTAPYMHNGSLLSLRHVVNFYNRGGIKNELLDPLITPLELDSEEINALVEFLHSLTGDNVEQLVMDAFAAPVGNTVSNR